jgi:hypothetical protein
MMNSQLSMLMLPTPNTLFGGHSKIRYAAQNMLCYLGLYYNISLQFYLGIMVKLELIKKFKHEVLQFPFVGLRFSLFIS